MMTADVDADVEPEDPEAMDALDDDNDTLLRLKRPLGAGDRARAVERPAGSPRTEGARVLLDSIATRPLSKVSNREAIGREGVAPLGRWFP